MFKIEKLIYCKCGADQEWSNGAMSDLVHCTNCGAVHYIYVKSPVVKIVTIEEIKAAEPLPWYKRIF